MVLQWGRNSMKLAGALATCALLLVPAIASAKPDAKKRPPAVSISVRPGDQLHAGFGRSQARCRIRQQGDRWPTSSSRRRRPKGRPSQIRVAIRARGADPAGGRAADLALASAPAIGALNSGHL